MIENLESRRLLTATVRTEVIPLPDATTFTVVYAEGSGKGDNINATLRYDFNVVLTIDGRPYNVSAADQIVINGNGGNDQISFLRLNQLPDPLTVRIDGGAGNDTITAHANSGPHGTEITLEGNAGNDTLRATQSTAGVQLLGGTGNDQLRGGSGPDALIGYDGNDTLHGFGGNDQMDGGEGNDTLYGGGGNDYLRLSAGRDRVFGEEGDDTVQTYVALLFDGTTYTYLSDDRADLIDGGAGNDLLLKGINDPVDHTELNFEHRITYNDRP